MKTAVAKLLEARYTMVGSLAGTAIRSSGACTPEQAIGLLSVSRKYQTRLMLHVEGRLRLGRHS